MTPTSITKIQRGVLEAAARRNDLTAWPIRDSKLNIGSSTRVLKELLRKGLVIEKPAAAKAPIWREDENGRPLMAVVTETGLEAVGMLPAGKVGRRSGTAVRNASSAANKPAVASVSLDEPRRPRPGTKLAVLIEMLGREEGSTIGQMVKATGWQAHTCRAVVSRMAKEFNLEIVSEKIADHRVYKIARNSVGGRRLKRP